MAETTNFFDLPMMRCNSNFTGPFPLVPNLPDTSLEPSLPRLSADRWAGRTEESDEGGEGRLTKSTSPPILLPSTPSSSSCIRPGCILLTMPRSLPSLSPLPRRQSWRLVLHSLTSSITFLQFRNINQSLNRRYSSPYINSYFDRQTTK